MAAENSFDVVSQYDEQELANALDQNNIKVAQDLAKLLKLFEQER